MAKVAAPPYGWWGQRWLDYLLRETILEPMTPGQAKGAERGEARLTVARGQIKAEVEVGSYGARETATFKVKPLAERDWKRAVDAIAGAPDAAHRLLSGAPGPELEEALAAAGLALFPHQSGRFLRCTCFDRWGCRHNRVLAVRSALLLDANPYLWFEVLGRSRDELLAAVRARLADRNGSMWAQGGGGLGTVDTERFLTTDADPSDIPVQPGETTSAGALLKLLGPIPLSDESADEVLARYAAAISEGAAQLATGERAPRYSDEPIPGKRIPLKSRLTVEIEEAVDRAEALLPLGELHAQCPTAAALPRHLAEVALADALAGLGDEYIALGGRFVGMRGSVLSGASFSHVVTFDEWRQGRLRPGADWHRALDAADFAPPYAVQAGGETCRVLDTEDWLFALLRPEVGDEIHFTVVDPSGPLLVAALRRRQHRSLTGVPASNQKAVVVLRHYINQRYDSAITEAEAVQLLLGEGLYRNEPPPGPVWLLSSREPGDELFLGRRRTLTTKLWQAYHVSFTGPYTFWHARQTMLDKFAATLPKEGNAAGAVACIEAWMRHWQADQTEVNSAPSLSALLFFLWLVAPSESRRFGIKAELVPRALGQWFRFLAARKPSLEAIFQEHVAACDLSEAYDHRLHTLPQGRGRDAELEAWKQEGYRWMGPELYFHRGY